MSSDQEFFIKINDIIGKTWLATLDDSEGYVLSLKLIEQNSLSVSPETELTVTETSSQNIAVPENYRNQPGWNENSLKKVALRRNFRDYFLTKKYQPLSFFVEKLNLYIANPGIPPVEYDDLGIFKNGNKNKTIKDKIDDLIRTFDDRRQLPILDEVFIDFQNSKL